MQHPLPLCQYGCTPATQRQPQLHRLAPRHFLAATGEEGELQLGAALVEAHVRLVLHNDAWGARAGVEGHRGLEDSEVIQVGRARRKFSVD